MILKFDAKNLEDFKVEFDNGVTELAEDMRPIFLRLGDKVADEMIRRIKLGEDLTGAKLKQNTESVLEDKAEKGLGNKPLIATGELTNRVLWKIKTRRAKLGVLSVTINPSTARKKVFYRYLPHQGYNSSQGMIHSTAAEATTVMAQALMEYMRRWIGDIE